MKIEKVLRKLRPLMPERVAAWSRSLDLVDADLRALLEKEIYATAHSRLGDFRNTLLLSLPSRAAAHGELHLGTIIYEAPKWPAGLRLSELLQNLAIFGRSGAGKTNVAFSLLEQLIYRGVPFLLLDWKRTGRHLLPKIGGRLRVYTPGRTLSPFPFNPFIPPPGLEPAVYVHHVVDVLGDAYTLGDAARSVLQKALGACYERGLLAPTVAEVATRVEAIPDKERVRGWKASALRALDSVAAIQLAADRSSQEAMVRALLQGHTVLELDGLAPSNKKLVAPLLALWCYYVKLADPVREQLRLVIIVEEAHHLLYHREGARESVMAMLLRQCREIGIAMVIVDQHPHLVSSAALGNTYASVCLNLKDPRDINKAAALSLVDEEDKRFFSMLPVGRGVVKLQDRWHLPFLVQWPLVAVRKGLVTDTALASFLRTGSLSALSASAKGEAGPEKRPRDSVVVGEDAHRLVQDVIDHPDDGVDARYRRLGLSADRGNRLKLELVAAGMLEQQRVRVGTTLRTMLRVPGVFSGLENRASLVHEFWKRRYAALLTERGYRVQLEAPRERGRVDVLATRRSERVAVEIETGKSDVVWNVRQNLLSGFERVVVVATEQHAFEKVDRQLAEAGLLISRVRLVLHGRCEGVL